MVRSFRTGLALALLSSAFLGPSGVRGQTPTPMPPATAPGAASGTAPGSFDYNPLPNLPRPLDEPRTLYAPAPATPTATCAPLPGPFFENDPLFDNRLLPQPGFCASAEAAIVVPHVREFLSGQVQFGTRAPDTVQLPNAPLDWTVAPNLTLGYRLPSGFGEFALSYRGFASQGTTSFLAVDGPAALKSRLDLEVAGLDYRSREYSLWPHWDMTWHLGLRGTALYFDSTANESLAAAAAGSGVFQQHGSSNYWGIGPDAGVTLVRHVDGTGLSFLASLDGANYLGRISQFFTETATATDATGAFLNGQTRNNGSQSVPMINVQAGLQYNLPQVRYGTFFAGYVYEYWWDIGRINNSGNPGVQMSDQGLVFRVTFNY